MISGGRAEIVVGRGSFIEAFPLFGYNLEDYDDLFAESLTSYLKFAGMSLLHGQVNSVRLLRTSLYREAGKKARYSPEQLKVGMHSPGYVANTTQEALDDFYPGYAEAMTKGGERTWLATHDKRPVRSSSGTARCVTGG